MKRHVEQRDFLKFHFLSNPSFSPDASRVAYRVSRPDRERNAYDSDLWVCDLETGANRRMTASGREDFYCWSRDGASLIFASGREDEAGSPKVKRTVFYSIPLQGGEAVRLFDVPYTAKSVKALDGHRWLLTVVHGPEYENPEEADFMVFEQVPFLANGRGYVGQERVGLALYDAEAGSCRLLTPPLMDVARCSLNRDRTEALIVGTEYKDVKPSMNAVYSMDLFTGSIRCLSAGLAFRFVHAVRCAGAAVVTGTDQKNIGVNENLKFYVLGDGRLDCLTPELDSSLAHSIVGDSHYGCSDLAGAFFRREKKPRGSAFSSESLVYCATNVMKSRLYELNTDGRGTQLTFDTSAVVDYCVQDTSTPYLPEARVAFVAYEGLHLPELYLWEAGKEKRLTNFNRPLFEDARLSQPIHIAVDNGRGWKLDGWYMRPASFVEGRKYPAILHVHGGPKAAFGDIYHHEMQCWAARGYAVLYCNPRGGDGRGSAFEDIRGKYGDADYLDVMVFVDWCVRNLNFVDGSRLGVTGGSYGGYMTNWIVTHTDRFKAAVSQRGVSNWVSKFGSCDIGYYYVEDQHLGTPWKDTENLWRESPLKYAAQAKTPILFVHSAEDFRCELDQGFQMFTALKTLGVESRMCVFKGENHELSRSGRPRSRLARLREIAAWFDTHL